MGNKPAKTPERYLKIRNHILDYWEKHRPQYVSKTACRKGLKDCGDVNAIGRVHAYLEKTGAINVDCVSPPTVTPKRQRRKVTGYYYYYEEEDDDQEDENT